MVGAEKMQVIVMGSKNKDLKEFAAAIRKAAREKQLEDEDQFGKLRSKSWDNRKSNRQERRQFKQNVTKMIDEDYDGDIV